MDKPDPRIYRDSNLYNPSLLQKILDNPEIDLYRLVYADWLLGQNDPRGEFIRIQHEISLKNENSALKEREQELLNQNKKSWLEPFNSAKRAQWIFEKGFVKTLHINAADLFNSRCPSSPSGVKMV